MERYCKNDKPYIYTVFSTSKQEQILPALEKVAKNGAAFWYADTFDRNEQRRLQGAFGVLLFVDKELADSERFRTIVDSAVACGQKILSVYLEDIPTSTWSRMQLGHQQSISADNIDDALVVKLKESFIFRDMKVTETQKKFQRNRAITLVTVPILIAVVAFFTVVKPLLIAAENTKIIEEQAAEWGLTREDLESVTELYIVGDQVFDTKVSGWYQTDHHTQVHYRIDETGEEGNVPIGTLTSEDLAIFSYMPNLRNLTICGNQITDISPLLELQNLHGLDLSANPISSVEGLNQLENLWDLDLDDTLVDDAAIPIICRCENIRSLNLSGTKVTDISGLEMLSSLHTLSISDTKVKDISMLWRAKDLHDIDLNNTLVNELPNFSVRDNLSLSFQGLTIQNLNVLARIKSFSSIRVDHASLSSLMRYIVGTPVDEFGCNHISGLTELNGLQLTQGSKLDISGNHLTTLDGIEQFEGIGTLDIRNSDMITNLTAALQLESLEVLVISLDMQEMAEEQLQDAAFKIQVKYDD